ncbi:hypothetical protein B0T10DRAFT_607368 [Thelonectria olida]|uniref:Uncharacterized protein n=1 Tax=Thelonectria olida TaxID=1576542 RepID=A0A9P8W636_9HYPO|nr:hypothetical protein B0T10DRAFT_607368 [Thelonectria olida]
MVNSILEVLPSQEQMERELGFTARHVEFLFHLWDQQYFYNDLTPVTVDDKVKIAKEYQLLKAKKTDWAPVRDETRMLRCPDIIGREWYWEYHVMWIHATKARGFHKYCVDVPIGPINFDTCRQRSLPLLFTEQQTLDILSSMEVGPRYEMSRRRREKVASPNSPFFKLPEDVRRKIIELLLPEQVWHPKSTTSLRIWHRDLGDQSGFHFAWGKEPVILRVAKWIREEALPLAWRKVTARLDDMDDMLRFLLSIGTIGRENITKMEVKWQSFSDFQVALRDVEDVNSYTPRLPSLHTARLTKLLRGCKSGPRIHVDFRSDMTENLTVEEFWEDAGIRRLCKLHKGGANEIREHLTETDGDLGRVKSLEVELRTRTIFPPPWVLRRQGCPDLPEREEGLETDSESEDTSPEEISPEDLWPIEARLRHLEEIVAEYEPLYLF